MNAKPEEQDFPIHWRLRPDVQVYCHDDCSAVLKDPLSGTYLLLAAHEYSALDLLEKSERLSDWHQKLMQVFPGSGIVRDDLKAFLNRLFGHQLLQSALHGSQVSSAATNSGGPLFLAMKCLSVFFRLRVPLARPTKFAESLTRRLEFVFTPTALLLYFGLLAVAVAVVVIRFAEFRSKIPALSVLLNASNLPYLIGMYLVIKLLHEVGHIVACTHFGAKVRDCGFLFLFFTPILYTNVSDSWILPRGQRILIAAAGILVELGIAAIFALLWWVAADGPIRYLLMNGILLCTVSTIAFNANPLLRFDGYFIVADILRSPNLYQRSIAATQNFMQSLWIDSYRSAADVVPDRKFLIFGILVCLYRVVLCMGLCSAAEAAADGLGLNAMDLPMKGLLLIVLAVLPVVRFIRQTISRAAAMQMLTRFNIRTMICAGLLWSLLAVPFQNSFSIPCVFIAEGPPIYADLSGELISSAKYHCVLESGERIAELQNHALHDQLLIAEAEFREKSLRIESLRRLGLDVSSEFLPTAIESCAASESQLLILRQQVAQLEIRSPRRGVLLPPEETPETSTANHMSKWAGAPLAPQNIGATLERGTLLGYVSTPNSLRIMAVLDEEQVEQFKIGGTAKVMCRSGEHQTYLTEVSDLSLMEVTDVPKCLIAQPENQWLISDRMSAATTIHAVSCKLVVDSPYHMPALYSSGILKVDGVSLSLGTRVSRFLRNTIFRSWI